MPLVRYTQRGIAKRMLNISPTSLLFSADFLTHRSKSIEAETMETFPAPLFETRPFLVPSDHPIIATKYRRG
jgi:hypothetical protein